MDPQTGQDLLEAGQDDCQTPRRTLDKADVQVEPSDIKSETMTIRHEMGKRHQQRKQRPHERHDNQYRPQLASTTTEVEATPLKRPKHLQAAVSVSNLLAHVATVEQRYLSRMSSTTSVLSGLEGPRAADLERD